MRRKEKRDKINININNKIININIDSNLADLFSCKKCAICDQSLIKLTMKMIRLWSVDYPVLAFLVHQLFYKDILFNRSYPNE